MKYYNAKLRLHGLVTNEVLKNNLSAPEVILLRKIHGDDAVVDIKFSKTAKINDAAERQRLAERYDSGLKKIEEPTSVNKLFGEGFTPLLDSLPDYDHSEAETSEKVEKQTSKKVSGVI